MSEELKPCPVCGEQPQVTKHLREEVWGLVHRCKYWGAITFEFAGLESIMDRWNHRAE